MDADQDGYGDTVTTLAPDGSCDTADSESADSTDCDDGNDAINPAATEVCDLVDNDCDDLIDEGFDTDADGFTTCGGDCDDTDAAINPDATEVCDFVDNNCNDAIDEGFDADADGVTTCGGDCLNVGVDVRYTGYDASVRPEGGSGAVELESGGPQYGFMIGYHW